MNLLPALDEIRQDRLAMSVAMALTIANETALAHGKDLSQSLVTINEEIGATGRLWRINYGARDFVHRRGGDLLIVVDATSGDVVEVTRGQ